MHNWVELTLFGLTGQISVWIDHRGIWTRIHGEEWWFKETHSSLWTSCMN